MLSSIPFTSEYLAFFARLQRTRLLALDPFSRAFGFRRMQPSQIWQSHRHVLYMPRSSYIVASAMSKHLDSNHQRGHKFQSPLTWPVLASKF
jgi:hypothetical protein